MYQRKLALDSREYKSISFLLMNLYNGSFYRRTLDNPKWETAEDTITDIATYFWEQMFGKNADKIVIGTNVWFPPSK